ncbi:amidohydrolase family protein [Streptomyces sp. enrichment culture]|uniref:amidohydrolase family protein n=1 Tax=Streptomyces sp. enrichment culture TaxID=1795815 RepID=UPI003F57B035
MIGRAGDESESEESAAARQGRRGFLKASAAAAAGAGLATVGSAAPSAAEEGGGDRPPKDTGRPGRRYLIRGGAVMSMDPDVGDFETADILVEGKKIVDVRPGIRAAGADVIDARGRIVVPGFADTHHHQFETALRGTLADAVLFDDHSGSPSAVPDYADFVLTRMAPAYRPQDVYINVLFSGLTQLDAGITTVHDTSQIHHSPEHSDASVQALVDSGRRSVLQYTAGDARPESRFPEDAHRLRNRWFSSDDQLVGMAMGGEFYAGGEESWSRAWKIGRQLGLQITAHVVSGSGVGPVVDDFAKGTAGIDKDLGAGDDTLFIHMTGVSDMAWRRFRDAGVQVSAAFPIEMAMRHGTPPILKMQELGMEPSLSSDVETTMAPDPFTLMRSAFTMQRMLVNQMILEQGDFMPPDHWPTPAEGTPDLLTVRDVLRFATLNGAKHLRLDHKSGSLTPGKEADIVLLDATAPHVTPLNNVPGAVVSLMDRSNVETVIVAGRVRKWRGRLLDVDLHRVSGELEASRDHLFKTVGVKRDLFGSS